MRKAKKYLSEAKPVRSGLFKKRKGQNSSEISNGNERIFGLLVAPTLFGETEAFDQGPCMITATALSKAEVAR
jgi:CRP-like cAMP-binding protein